MSATNKNKENLEEKVSRILLEITISKNGIKAELLGFNSALLPLPESK